MKRTRSFADLSQALITHLKNTRTIHSERTSKVGSNQTWELDTTNIVEDGGSKINIRENITLEQKSEDEFIYSTQSTKVEAEGSAAYLKAVSFSAHILPSLNDKNSVDILMRNSIKVEKPWYALLVFEPIAKSIAKDKFTESVHIILSLIEKHLYDPQRVAERKNENMED